MMYSQSYLLPQAPGLNEMRLLLASDVACTSQTDESFFGLGWFESSRLKDDADDDTWLSASGVTAPLGKESFGAV
jgi:hypothetical protein